MNNTNQLKFSIPASPWSAPSYRPPNDVKQTRSFCKLKKTEQGDVDLVVMCNSSTPAKRTTGAKEKGICNSGNAPNSGRALQTDKSAEDSKKCRMWVMEAKLPWDKSADIMSNGHRNWSLHLTAWEKLLAAKQMQRICNRKCSYPAPTYNTRHDPVGNRSRESHASSKNHMKARLDDIVSSSAFTQSESRCKRQQMQGFLDRYSNSLDNIKNKETFEFGIKSGCTQVGLMSCQLEFSQSEATVLDK